jgi:transcriptional regulator with XRE-family HTH domain
VVSDQIREAIEASGLAQAELSRRSGVPQPVISRFLSGDVAKSSTLDRLCEVISIEVSRPGEPSEAKRLKAEVERLKALVERYRMDAETLGERLREIRTMLKWTIERIEAPA